MSTGRRLTILTGGMRVMICPGCGSEDVPCLEDDFLLCTSSGKCCLYTDTQNLKQSPYIK